MSCSSDGPIDHSPSDGFEVHGPYSDVGAMEIKFAINAMISVDYTRLHCSLCDSSCPVELLKNGVVVGRVPNGENDLQNGRTRTRIVVKEGDTLTFREGADGSTCGVHLYRIEISCGKL